MNRLDVKYLHPDAKIPTVAHPEEDLAYDFYALEGMQIPAFTVGKIRTGIAARAFRDSTPLGMLLKARSGMASFGYRVEGGVIDSRYVGEIIVLLYCPVDHTVMPGDKVAQAVPVEVLTGTVIVVDELEAGTRGDRGFGSTGR